MPKANQAIIFDIPSDTWTRVKDLRGTTYYLPPHYVPQIHQTLDALPENAVTEIPLTELKKRALERLDGEFFTHISKNIHLKTRAYKVDTFNMTLLLSAIADYPNIKNEQGYIKWRLADRSCVDVDDIDLSAVRTAYQKRTQRCIEHAENFNRLIMNAENAAALASIDLSAGWPS